ncbi:unnamed protein product [Calicophoron daubneyi]|uniref:Uncharacterized protein n=1 Tax=Calicophoron daubneyi TaxID=300641 RepID=A0AAV2TE94_CALDB
MSSADFYEEMSKLYKRLHMNQAHRMKLMRTYSELICSKPHCIPEAISIDHTVSEELRKIYGLEQKIISLQESLKELREHFDLWLEKRPCRIQKLENKAYQEDDMRFCVNSIFFQAICLKRSVLDKSILPYGSESKAPNQATMEVFTSENFQDQELTDESKYYSSTGPFLSTKQDDESLHEIPSERGETNQRFQMDEGEVFQKVSTAYQTGCLVKPPIVVKLTGSGHKNALQGLGKANRTRRVRNSSSSSISSNANEENFLPMVNNPAPSEQGLNVDENKEIYQITSHTIQRSEGVSSAKPGHSCEDGETFREIFLSPGEDLTPHIIVSESPSQNSESPVTRASGKGMAYDEFLSATLMHDSNSEAPSGDRSDEREVEFGEALMFNYKKSEDQATNRNKVENTVNEVVPGKSFGN